MMNLLGENVLYVDTDSCIYVNKPGGPKAPLGDYLGDWTNEITPKNGQVVILHNSHVEGRKIMPTL